MSAIEVLTRDVMVDSNLIGGMHLSVQVNISHLVHPVLIEWDDILQILYQAGDPVVMRKFVQHIGHVE